MDEKKMDTDLTDLDIYQNWVGTMHQFTSNDTAKELMWMTLGLTAEAGEVAGEIEKTLRKKNVIDFEDYDLIMAVASELGDTLFWIASIASKFELSLDDILMANMSKLNARKPV